ncbi:hypothetical protein KFU94_35880 [Chloroflexi bacterium TSY]|nr:hypothetical protein [Chloroflexi bacterium TSY]
MKTLCIKSGEATIRLSPAQCAVLAKICHQAYSTTFSGDIDQWRTFETLFHACAIAGFTQQHLCPYNEIALYEQLLNADL